MDLKRKLERLGPVGPARSSPPGGAGAAQTATASDPKAATLDALRRQMARILDREPPPVRPPPDPTLGELPFARLETPLGPVHHRIVRHARSHHVGRIPVDAALAAQPEVLALLALDPSLSTASAAGALFLDTETTGLGGVGTLAFLVGLAAFDEGELVVEQLLLRTPAEEASLLHHVRERIERASLVVTFNGKAFDVPTLESRYVMNRMPVPARRPHLDLLHVARRLHRARTGSSTLKSIEAEVLGFVRDADIDGGEVAPRYTHFLRTGDASVLEAVIEHNSWDVVSMAALVGLYGEPLGTLHHDDLVGLARTYRRARAFSEAERAAEAAVARGAGPEGLRVRGEIAKARGDRLRALGDFEALAQTVDEPAVRLELAKLYEHFVKSPERALELVHRGTGEAPEALARRKARLERKRARRDKAV
jgi:uncharacterized protein YprB with RNaseH-like and TPR domain